MRANPAKLSAIRPGRDTDREALFLVGMVAESLSPTRLFDSLESGLEILRDAAGADDCELFLAEYDGGDLLLSACQGRDRDALMTRPRFGRGQGYPGIVANEKRPLVTSELQKDNRYLRQAVKQRGIHSYACVPLTDFGSGVLGSLNLAWRRTNVPLERVSNLMQRVAKPISSAIYAGQAGWRASVRTALARTPERARPEDWLANLLRTFQNQTGADGGTVFLFDHGRQRIVQAVSTGGVSAPARGVVDVAGQKCIDLCDRQGVSLIAGGQYHLKLCKKIADSGHAACCAPLVFNGRLVGRILLDYGESPRPFLNTDLINLTTITDEAAHHIPTRFFDPDLGGGKIRPAGMRCDAEESLVMNCLGVFSVNRGGRPLPLSSFSYRNKARTLLKTLLLRAGKSVNRDALIELLWPETNSVAGANRLHGVVHALRAAIEPYYQGRDWTYIRRDGDRYFFNMDSPHQVDLFEFRRLLYEASHADQAQSEKLVIGYLQRAIALYRGDLFDSEFDAEYFEPDRETLRQLFLQAVERLVEIRTARGEFQQAAGVLRRALRFCAVEENLHQTLIKVLLMQGKRREAMKQLDRCAEILRKELDVDPLPETLRLKNLTVRPA